MTELTKNEQKVRDSVTLHGSSLGINPDTIACAFPALDVFAIVQQLVDRGVIERVGAGAIRIADVVPPANAEPSVSLAAIAPPAEMIIAKPRKPPRPYFARLDPRKDMKKQIASRIVQYIAANDEENGQVVYMVMYHSLHGNRYRDRDGHDLWGEALRYLGRAVRRGHGCVWLDRETRLISDLPSPYKPLPKFKPRKRKPRTAWYQAVASQAEANGLSISEQIAADRTRRCHSK
jgi:hypothetical protein